MRITGRLLLPLPLLIALAATIASAQTDCPTIKVTGPAGIPENGALIPFHARATGKVSSGITYKWSVSTGKVAEGQGTDRAKFDVGWPTTAQVTATVEVRGLPEGCPNTASDTLAVSIDPGQILVSSTGDASSYTKRVNEFVKQLENYPTSQGYIYIGSASADRYKQIEQLVRDTAGKAVLDQARLTITHVASSKELIELWIIQPGVDNPLCKACEPIAQESCPTIEVTGPPGIMNPGEVIRFSGNVSGARSDGLTYLWHIDGGELISGQGTLAPRVKPKGVWEIQMTATLEIKGLPDGCAHTASETFAQACKCEPVLFDEFSIAPNRIDKRRLDALVESLVKYPGATIFIIEYFRPRTTQAVISKKVELVRTYLLNVRGLKPSEFEIVTDVSPEDRETTRLYVIPPGAERPTP